MCSNLQSRKTHKRNLTIPDFTIRKKYIWNNAKILKLIIIMNLQACVPLTRLTKQTRNRGVISTSERKIYRCIKFQM